MNTLSIEERVNHIKEKFKVFAQHPEHTCVATEVSASEIRRLQSLEGFPPDMLLVLSEIGTMKWGFRECLRINWWIPCKIAVAMNDDRCYYQICEENFVNGGDLLVFANDVNGDGHFYDAKARPWSLISRDCVDLSIDNTNGDKVEAILLEPGYYGDFIAIIEFWVEACLGAKPLEDFKDSSDEFFG
jgi:hypothetical protein